MAEIHDEWIQSHRCMEDLSYADQVAWRVAKVNWGSEATSFGISSIYLLFLVVNMRSGVNSSLLFTVQRLCIYFLSKFWWYGSNFIGCPLLCTWHYWILLFILWYEKKSGGGINCQLDHTAKSGGTRFCFYHPQSLVRTFLLLSHSKRILFSIHSLV